jgi:hypothetical protein
MLIPRPDQAIGDLPPDPRDQAADEPGPVLQRAAESPGAFAGAEQFVEQVAVALLQVDEVEPERGRPLRGGDVAVREPFQLGVGDQGAPRAGALAGLLVEHRAGIEHGVVLGDHGAADAVAPGVGQLQPDDEVAVVPEGPPVRPSAGLQQPGDLRGGLLRQKELPGVRAPLGDDGRRLHPDQLGPAGAEPLVAPDGQVAGGAVRVPVAPLHRLDRHPVADRAAAERVRPEQGGEVLRQAEIQPPRLGIGEEGSRRLVLEETGQGTTPLPDPIDEGRSREFSGDDPLPTPPP